WESRSPPFFNPGLARGRDFFVYTPPKKRSLSSDLDTDHCNSSERRGKTLQQRLNLHNIWGVEPPPLHEKVFAERCRRHHIMVKKLSV
ncbi:hypothetical protein, partial [Williamwhitmania taraxaci]|uniref:hypothetical protein n=1 Tax=Williamwhitmania taraxaci TaxID=1640674 RepID=UPI001BAFD300